WINGKCISVFLSPCLLVILQDDVPAISASAVLTCHTAPVSGRKLR
ncbi:hypothetical protein DBR06_SOUSAS105010001, partial [Sousa chinensis]